MLELGLELDQDWGWASTWEDSQTVFGRHECDIRHATLNNPVPSMMSYKTREARQRKV